MVGLLVYADRTQGRKHGGRVMKRFRIVSDYDLRSVMRYAVAALMTDGLTIRQIGDDLDRFVAKVLDMKPNLRRASH